VAFASITSSTIGFTDACAVGDAVVFIAAAEASANAIDDGVVLACVIGVYDREGVRTAPLPFDNKPEGLAMRGTDHAWITVDPDDPDAPTTLYEVGIDRINRSK
jgi:hypothetical protein